MSEFEKRVLSELADLRRIVESLRSDFSISQITYFENLPAAAVVGMDYVAFRFGCSESAVVRGRFETDRIPRLREKPIAFIKRDVDAVWLNLNQSVTEKAAQMRHETKNRTEKKKNAKTKQN